MSRYPTEEELNAFIERMERQELYAPKHLKQQILQRVSEMMAEEAAKAQSGAEVQERAEAQGNAELQGGAEAQSRAETQGRAEATVRKSAHKSVQMFVYSFKVAAGMAAALLMLVLFPVGESRAADAGYTAYGEQRQIEMEKVIAQREAKQEEDYRVWEEKLLKDVQEESKETLLEKGRSAVEQKFSHIIGNVGCLWGNVFSE